jgi:hypothetical protein
MLIGSPKPFFTRFFSLIAGLVLVLFLHCLGPNQWLSKIIDIPEISALIYSCFAVVELVIGYLIATFLFDKIDTLKFENGAKITLGFAVIIIFLASTLFFSGMLTVTSKRDLDNNVLEESLEVKLGIIAAESNRNLPVIIQKDFLTLERMSSDNLSLIYHYSFNIDDELASKVLADKDSEDNLKNLMFLGEGNNFCKDQEDLLTKDVRFLGIYSTNEGREFARAILTRADCGL